MFRSSEAAARARIADLERRIAELKEAATDREEEHAKRIQKLEAKLDRWRRGETPHRGCWIVVGAAVGMAVLVMVGYLLVRTDSPTEVTVTDPEALCTSGDAAACVQRGYELRSTDPAGAERVFRRGCDLGAMAGCGEVGWMLMARGDFAAAEPLLVKACDAEQVRACVNAGVILAKRNDPGSEKLYRKACDGGDALGCSNLAGALDKKGELDKAVEVATKSCDKGSPFGCAELAWCMLKKKKVAESLKHATRASQINAQLPKVQVNLGYALAVDGDVEEAIRRFRRGIELEEKPGNERTFNDKPWAALIRQNLEFLKTIYPDRVKDIDAILGRHREWNP